MDTKRTFADQLERAGKAWSYIKDIKDFGELLGWLPWLWPYILAAGAIVSAAIGLAVGWLATWWFVVVTGIALLFVFIMAKQAAKYQPVSALETRSQSLHTPQLPEVLPVEDIRHSPPENKSTEATEQQQIVSFPRRVLSPAVRETIRRDLKPFFRRGYELLDLYKSSKYRDEEPWQEWVQDVNTFLRNSLDESYIDRWNSGEGLTVYSARTPFSPLPVEVPGRNRKLYADVSFRLQRLAEFDNELKKD